MKKILMSMGLMFAALTLTNCSQDINDSVVPTTPAGAEFSITASLDATRTVAEGMSTTWAAEDGMNIMHAVADAATYTNDGEFAIEDVAAGQFKGTLGADLESEQSYDWYAIYPYNENISSPASTDKWRQLSYKEQTQEGYDSTAHIVGANGALYGITEGVANDAAVTFQMHHLTSMLAFNVTNKCAEPFIIQSVAFTAAGKDIAGTFYVDITGDAPTYVSSGDAYTFETITLTVANGEEVAVNGSAMLYMSVVPFAVGTGETLEVVVNTNKGSYTKSLTMTGDVTFAAGKATKLSVNAEFDIENFEVVPVGVGLDANNQQETLSWTYGENDNFTTTIVNGTASYNPREDTDGQLRMYKGNELTFTAVSGSIVKIEMTVTDGGNTLTASVGNMAYDEDSKVITWTGRMNEVKFTTSAKIFFNPIKVYYSDEEPIVVQPLATPEIIAEVQNLTEAYVIWGNVENAVSYTVTCGEQTQTVAAGVGEATFTGLAYSTEYTISVVANPEVGSLYYVASEAATTTVTTGADLSIDYSGEYMIVAKRSSGNFYYMTSDLGTASTKRFQIVDTNAATIDAVEENEQYVWVVEKSGDNYTIKTTEDQYITWGSGNSANLAATGIAMTITANGDAVNIRLVDDASRYLSLNGTSGNNYFAFYAGTQINDLYLIPFTGKVKATTTVEFDGEESYTVNLGDVFTSPSCNVTIGDQLNPDGVKPTYTSSDENVATVAEDGIVTILAAGTTTITATVNATETYKFGEDSYKITVVDGSITGSTVTMSTFTATAASLDTVISYTCNKGGGTSNPAINSGEIRLYQGNPGGNIIISAAAGYKIQSITIGSSMKTTLGYGVGSDTATVTNVSLAANGKYTLSDLSAQKVSFHCYGSDKNSRLYVNYLEVTYVKE